LQVRQIDRALAGRHRSSDDQATVGIEDLVVEIKKRCLPRPVPGNSINVIETDEFAALQTFEQFGTRIQQKPQRYIHRSITGTVAHGLQQVCLAGRWHTPQPATLATAGNCKFA